MTAEIADDTNHSLFVGTYEGYVYKYESVYNSSTGGYDSTLTPLNGNREFGDDAFGTAHPVKDLALPGADGSMVAVATGLGGLWVSPSGGGTGSWLHVYDPGSLSPPRNFMNTVAADPLDANRLVFYGFDSQRTLFTGLFETTDLLATLAAADPDNLLDPEYKAAHILHFMMRVHLFFQVQKMLSTKFSICSRDKGVK